MTLLLLCIKIFLVRIVDVSMGTFRTIMVVKGRRYTASLVGFVEIFIWFTVIRDALTSNETSIFIGVAYAGGFACGTLVGSYISEKYISGNLAVNVITDKTTDIINILRDKGFAVTVIEAKGKDSDKYLLHIEINKKKLYELERILKKYDPSAFTVVSETKLVKNGFIK